MSTDLKDTIHQYIAATKWATLATVREDGAPVLRVMGSFAPDDGLNVYFSTQRAADKVRHIRANNLVNFYFQHEGQALDAFTNVALIGKAFELTNELDRDKAIKLLSAKSPRFRERAEKGELGDTAIFRIDAKEIKYLDRSRGVGKAGLQELILE